MVVRRQSESAFAAGQVSVREGRDSMLGDEDQMRPVPDLTVMDEDDQHREIYAWAGLALHYAQVFEQGIDSEGGRSVPASSTLRRRKAPGVLPSGL